MWGKGAITDIMTLIGLTVLLALRALSPLLQCLLALWLDFESFVFQPGGGELQSDSISAFLCFGMCYCKYLQMHST